MRALDKRLAIAVLGAALLTYGLFNFNSAEAQTSSIIAIILGIIIIWYSRS